jgi:hypothetical protein
MSQQDTVSLQGPPAEVRMTLQITRAATGKTETVELVGRVAGIEPNPQPEGEPAHVGDSLDGRA